MSVPMFLVDCERNALAQDGQSRLIMLLEPVVCPERRPLCGLQFKMQSWPAISKQSQRHQKHTSCLSSKRHRGAPREAA